MGQGVRTEIGTIRSRPFSAYVFDPRPRSLMTQFFYCLYLTC